MAHRSQLFTENCFGLCVEGGIAGGLIGYGRAGTIKLFSLWEIYAPGIVGGLVGISANSGLTAINCYAEILKRRPLLYTCRRIDWSGSADTVITNAYWNSDAKQTVNGADVRRKKKRG